MKEGIWDVKVSFGLNVVFFFYLLILFFQLSTNELTKALRD